MKTAKTDCGEVLLRRYARKLSNKDVDTVKGLARYMGRNREYRSAQYWFDMAKDKGMEQELARILKSGKK